MSLDLDAIQQQAEYMRAANQVLALVARVRELEAGFFAGGSDEYFDKWRSAVAHAVKAEAERDTLREALKTARRAFVEIAEDCPVMIALDDDISAIDAALTRGAGDE